MYRLVESIKVQNKQFQHLEEHNRRFYEARSRLLGINEPMNLAQVLEIPETLTEGVYKCRVLYAAEIEAVEFQPYVPRNVRSLKLVESPDIDYTFKYADRSALERLLLQKGRADDVLIVKNGHITDTSFSNVVLYNGSKWITPNTFLLDGTQRRWMLAKGLIVEESVTPSDLKRFVAIRPINAMLDFDATPDVEVVW